MQAATSNQPTSEGLLRAIRRWDLVALAVNGIIGAGIFGLPSEAFSRIGVYSLAAFIVCGAAVALIVLCFAEVASRFTQTGGPYLYAREAFGPAVGFQVGWMMWVARTTAFAVNCNVLLAYLTFFVPAAGGGLVRAGIITLIVVSLTAVNVVGVRDAAVVTNVFTVAKLVPLAIFVVAGMFFLDPAAFTPGPLPGYGDFSVAVLLLIYAFSAFEQATVAGGEARDPRRDVPYAMLLALAVVVVIYVGIQIVAVGTLPTLASATRPLADAAGRFLGAAGAALMTVGAIVSIFGNLNGILLVASRITFAMAQRGELPPWIGATHARFHTPQAAILSTAALALVLTISGTFVYILTVSVIARLLVYAGTCAALPTLRRRTDVAPAAFVAPAGTLIAFIALALVAWLLTHITLPQARDAAITAAAGQALYWAATRRRRAPEVGSSLA